MNKAGARSAHKGGALIPIKDLVLDPLIDNSATQALSFYSVAAPSPPFTRQALSPHRKDPSLFNGSHFQRSRSRILDDEEESNYTDTMSLDRDPPRITSTKLNPIDGGGSTQSGTSTQIEKAEPRSLSHRFSDKEVGFESTHSSPKSDKSSPKSKVKKYTPISDLTVRYHNMGEWLAESREPRAMLLLIKMNEEIIFRETILESLKAALDVMDRRYWQYCVERIKATEANRTIKSETLVSLHNQLSEAQKHVAVLIAHARSLAIELVEKVKQLRQIHAKSVKTDAVVSIFWKNENYLLKMKKDMEFINESPTLRLWLGFTARELVLPPYSSLNTTSTSTAAALTHVVNPHDPKAHWVKTSRHVYKEWFKRHEAYIQASWKAGKSKVIFKTDRRFLTGDTRASLGQIKPFPMQSPSVTPGLTPFLTPDPSRSDIQSPSGANSGYTTSRGTSGLPSARQAPANASTITATIGNNSGSEPYTPPRHREEPLDRQLSSPFLTRESTPAARNITAQLSCASIASTDSLATTPLGRNSTAQEAFSFAIDPIVETASHGASEKCDTDAHCEALDSTDALAADRSEGAKPEQEQEQQTQEQNPEQALQQDECAVGDSPKGEGDGREEASKLLRSYTTETDGGFTFADQEEDDEFDALRGSVDSTEREECPQEPEQEGDGTDQQMTPTDTGSAVPQTGHTIVGGVAGTVEAIGIAILRAQADCNPPDAEGVNAKVGAQAQSGPRQTQRRRSKSGVDANPPVPESAPVAPAADEVPEWMQLRDYVKHSWGALEVEEELREFSGDLDRRGTQQALHDAKDGLSQLPRHMGHGVGGGSHGLIHSSMQQAAVDAKHGINDPTVGFRDSVVAAPAKHRATVYLQGRSAAPLFWRTVDHNPLVVEAATGFEECFPTIYLVPPMPSDLLVRAEKCARLLRREYEQEVSIRAQREVCNELKVHVLPSITTESLDSLATEAHTFKGLEDAALLRLRQQGTTELLKGVSVRHLSQSLSLDAGSLASLVVPSTSQLLAKQRSMVDGAGLLENSTDNVFLTDSLEQGDSQQLLRKASEESLLLPNVQSFGSYVDTTTFSFFRIEECSKLRQRIEDRIIDGRRIVEYKEGEFFPSVRPERRGIREPDHDSPQWLYIHAVRIQSRIRVFLARRRVLKMRVVMKFNRSAHKVRTLVIGFMWRYRQRQKYWEARFEAFVMRKMAVKKFRASMTLAAFFRKIVRARRQMREDDARAKLAHDSALATERNATKHRISMAAYTPISRNVRRRHGQKFAEDGDSSGLPTHRSSAPDSRLPSPSRSRATTATTRAPSPTRAAQGHGTTITTTITATATVTDTATSPDKTTRTDRHVTISAEVAACDKGPGQTGSHAPTTQSTALAADLEQASRRLSMSSSAHVYSGLLTPAPDKLTPHERLRRLEAAGPYEESKRREQLRNDALNLIAKVNRGKIQADTLHSCRLIPTQAAPNTHAKMKKFSTHEYAFFNMPSQAPPQSLIKSSSDVFVGPIPKRVNTTALSLSASAEILRTASAEAVQGSVSGVSSCGSSVAEGPGAFRGITIARGGSYSAFATPAASMKLARAGSHVIHSSASSVSSKMALRTTSPQGPHSSYRRTSGSTIGSAAGSPESVPGKALELGSSALHFGEVQSTPGSAGHGGVAPLLRYNSTGLSLRTKKQVLAHEKAEAERVQLRSALLKYM